MKLPRSNRKRIIKKWFKRTGNYKITKRDYVDSGEDGYHMYKLPYWVG